MSTPVLRIVTMPRENTPHDPAACRLMVCPEEVCIRLNGARLPQHEGNASPLRRAA